MAALLSVAVACAAGNGEASGDTARGAAIDGAPDSMGIAPSGVVVRPIRTARNLRENSGLAPSATQAGVLFTIDDSGNEPMLFALDTLGVDRGAWKIAHAMNVDWEAVSVGSCGRATSCVYIGDVGDNDEKHETRTIYRVAEPAARNAAFVGAVDAERVSFVYPDRHHDVEAMFVASNGDVFLVTKRALTTADGRLRPALVFRIPAVAWSGKRGSFVAELIDSLSVVPGSAPLRAVTDASLSRDGRQLAVRTYTQLFVYATDSSTGRIDHATAPAICNLTPLGQAQGEGVAWIGALGRFAFSSEGGDAPLHLATCPIPR